MDKSHKDDDVTGGSSAASKFSFWVKANISDEAAVRYKVERVFVAGADGEKIGEALADTQGRFKITLPSSYKETKQRFTVEFSRKSSFLDEIPAIANNAMAVSILKAFYYITPEKSRIKLPNQGAEMIIPSPSKADEIEINDLKMGYSEKSHDVLINLPNIPPLYKIELNQEEVSKYTSQGYRAYFGFIDTPDAELSSTAFLGGEPNPNLYAGFCAGDDWYLVINNTAKIKPVAGTTVRLWIVFTHQSMSPRLCYKDIQLPEIYGNISVAADFAGLPVDSTAFVVLIAGGYLDISGTTKPAEEVYVQIQSIVPVSGPWQHSGIFAAFEGEWHGGGYMINNISLNSSGFSGYYGLFGKMEGKPATPGTNDRDVYAMVTDLVLNVTDVGMTAGSPPLAFGGIAGLAGQYSKISNVKVKDTASTKKFNSLTGVVGGLVGESAGGATVFIDSASCEWPSGVQAIGR